MLRLSLLLMVLLFGSQAQAQTNFSGNSKVSVENDTSNFLNTQVVAGGANVSIDFGSGEAGADKYPGGLLGAYYMGVPETPNIPLPQASKGGSWRLQAADLVFAGLPAVLTPDSIRSYEMNKTILVDDKDDKKELREKFDKAKRKLLLSANVVLPVVLPETNSIRLSKKLPAPNGMLFGESYSPAGNLTFHTVEELDGWFQKADMKSLSSGDLAVMLASAGMKCGASLMVPTGQGAENIFNTTAGSKSLSGLLSSVTNLAGQNALPSAVSAGGGISGTDGNNNVVHQPYLTVALFKKEAGPVKGKLQRDIFYELVMCALPVPEPNGRLRLEVANQMLQKYFDSGRNNVEPLIHAQANLAQSIKDGKKSRIIKEALAATWAERVILVGRGYKQGLMTEREYKNSHLHNLKKAEGAMSSYGFKSIRTLDLCAKDLSNLK